MRSDIVLAPKVSIIIPIYNTEQYLGECLESLLRQTLREIEIIAIDDGSTDGSLEIVKRYEGKYGNMRVFSQKNKGLGAARNRGLRLATGKYVYFMDSDDTLEIEALEVCYHLAELHTLNIVGFQADIFGETIGRNPNQYIYAEKIYDINAEVYGIDFIKDNYKKVSLLNIPMLFFSKKFLEDNELFFLESVYYEDVEFYHRFISYNPKMIITDNTYYHRRYRINSIMTSEVTEKKIKDRLCIYLKICEMACPTLKELYAKIALKGVRTVLQDSRRNGIQLSSILFKFAEKIVSYTDSIKFSRDFSFISDLYYCYIMLEEQKRITLRKEEIIKEVKVYLKRINEAVKLDDEKSIVGIYGMGKECEMLFDIYIREIGNVKSKTIFIDSNCKTGLMKYRGYNVFNVKDITDMELTTILITSIVHEKTMLNNIDLYTDKRNVTYSLGQDFGY